MQKLNHHTKLKFMSNNFLNRSEIEKEIMNINLSQKVVRMGYQDLFYDHLTGMTKFDLLGGINAMSTTKLNQRGYMGLEQYIFEHAEVVEVEESAIEIEWETINILMNKLRSQIKNVLKVEYESDLLKPIINFTISTYENYLIYKNLYPLSSSNPWIPTRDILKDNGCLILVSDKKDFISELNKNILKDIKDDSSDLFVVAMGANEKKIKGFQVDSRNKSQSLVYGYLKENAIGYIKAKKSKDIREFLESKKIKYTEQQLRNDVLLPLKRAALIGSITQGYFFINSKNDLIESYSHHEKKLNGIQKTLNMYKERANKMHWVL